jgi:hypothetical protein
MTLHPHIHLRRQTQVWPFETPPPSPFAPLIAMIFVAAFIGVFVVLVVWPFE